MNIEIRIVYKQEQQFLADALRYLLGRLLHRIGIKFSQTSRGSDLVITIRSEEEPSYNDIMEVEKSL